MSEEKNSIVVSLLNVCSNIEAELKRCATEKTKFFGTTIMKKDALKDSEAYIFSSIKVPEALSENLVAWVIFIKILPTAEMQQRYVMSLNIRNKQTGDAYATFECEMSEESWKDMIEVSKLYSTNLDDKVKKIIGNGVGKGLKSK